jgi:hypothetical protein
MKGGTHNGAADFMQFQCSKITSNLNLLNNIILPVAQNRAGMSSVQECSGDILLLQISFGFEYPYMGA